jgi:poly(3-hydroxybutyrate) depolymerase
MDMIDTNRVFITGYSAGGDGIYHLASMMADVLSGAAMMAGHPNRAEVYNLRNLAFSVQVG